MKSLSHDSSGLINQFKNKVKADSMNKTRLLTALILLMLPILFGSCEAVGDIFKAGMNFGIFIVLAIIIVIVVLLMRSGKNKSSR